jgi:hypothetical protein
MKKASRVRHVRTFPGPRFAATDGAQPVLGASGEIEGPRLPSQIGVVVEVKILALCLQKTQTQGRGTPVLR